MLISFFQNGCSCYVFCIKRSIFVYLKTTTVEHTYLQELNDAQREAVLYNDGPSLVIAGAGSGKTRVLTYKIAYLLASGEYSPYNILALTFTNKAAREMKERIASVVGGGVAARLWMGTFHSIFLRILRTHAERINFRSDFTIYDQSDSRSLIKTIIKEMGLDDKVYKPATVQAVISNAKNALITPNVYATNTDCYGADVKAKRPLIRDIYKSYWSRCIRAGAMDFDDLLLYTNILFRDCPDVLEIYRRQFRYILVDEYQDTNFAQHLIVNQLAKGHQRLCVVGDDAQSIYSFRGANIDNILNIRREFPDCRIFKLEQNYRSTRTIVSAANSLIAKNTRQIEKNIFSKNEVGAKIPVVQTYSDFEEGYLVANRILSLRMSTASSFSDFAILYRTNSQSRIFEEALRKRNVPYRIYGGQSFYQRKEIKDVIAYFRLAINPTDEEALKRIINYPTRGIGDTTMTKVALCANNHDVSMWDIVSDPVKYALDVNAGTQRKLVLFATLIRGFVELIATVDAYTATESIIKQSGILQDVFSDRSPENISRQDNIQELQNGVQEFCAQRQEEGNTSISLIDFLSEISLATDQDSETEGETDTDTDRVTLMTVHASKGLEFKHVFVVGLEEDLFPSSLAQGSVKEIEEERRLLYVAITRAEQTCQLSYALSRYHNGKPTAPTPSRFLKDIDPQYLNVLSNNSLPQKENSEFSTPFNRSAAWKVNHQSRENQDSLSRKNTSFNYKDGSASMGRGYNSQRLVRISNTSHNISNTSEIPEGLKVGAKIRHDRFGIGEIFEISGSGDNLKIAVNFEHVGTKHLLLKFAKFEVIG